MEWRSGSVLKQGVSRLNEQVQLFQPTVHIHILVVVVGVVCIGGQCTNHHMDMEDDSLLLQTDFGSLGVEKWLCEALQSVSIYHPTEIQRATIPPILEGRDCIGNALTGSGKTAAFALPILQSLSHTPFGIFALILTPSRELSYQIAEQFKVMGRGPNSPFVQLKIEVVVGGANMMTQSIALANKPHIVIGTPGRVRDHIERTPDISFDKIKFLVLDEADRLLESGFLDDMRAIMPTVNSSNRQTLLFSATMTENIEVVRKVSLKNPFTYDAVPSIKTVASLRQEYLFMPESVKECYLYFLLQQQFEKKSVIIFVDRVRTCQFLHVMLKSLEIRNTCLHSALSQLERSGNLNKFRSHYVNVLVCTGVASRGLDIPQVELVINYDLPQDPTEYIHRVGRTARAGKHGRAIAFVTQYAVKQLQAIEERIQVKMTEYHHVEKEVLESLKLVANAKRLAKMELLESGFEDKLDKVKSQKAKRALRDQSSNGGSTTTTTATTNPQKSGQPPQKIQKHKHKKQR